MSEEAKLLGDDRLLRDREAAAIYGVSRSKFWAGVRAGLFPSAIKIGGITRWSSNACQADIRRRFAEAQGEAA